MLKFLLSSTLFCNTIQYIYHANSVPEYGYFELSDILYYGAKVMCAELLFG